VVQIRKSETVTKVLGLVVLWGGALIYKYCELPVSVIGILFVLVGSFVLMLRGRAPEPPATQAPAPVPASARHPSPAKATRVGALDRSAHDVLEHVPFVALSVGPDLKVSPGGASRLAQDALGEGQSLAGRDFVELVLGDDAKEGETLREWFHLIFEKPDQDWDTVLNLCPLEAFKLPEGGEFSEFRLRYHAMRAGDGGPIVRVLVVGTDVTEQRALAKELETRDRDDEASVKRFAEVLKLGAETFRRFINEGQTRLAEAAGAVETLEAAPEDAEARRVLMRQIHTLKANARALRLDWIADAAARTEDSLSELKTAAEEGGTPSFEIATELIESLHMILDDTEVLGTTVFGRSLDPGEVRTRERDLEVPVRVGRLETIIAMVRASKMVSAPTAPQAADLLGKAEKSLDVLRNVPARNLFQRFPKMVADLAAVMGKRLNPLRVTGSDMMLNVRTLDRVGDALVHLLRNAVAHGIESTDVRIAADKLEAGSIDLSLKHEGDRFLFEVCDDGGGVDVNAVRAAALQASLITEQQAESVSDSDIRQLIFEPGFSTLTSVSDTAGRGVGLDMVKAAADFLGGEAVLESEPGRGTTVRLVIPDRWPC
jgi:signal transduction histidine kinase